jgi:DNA-binding MarR family transcriptional regulator
MKISEPTAATALRLMERRGLISRRQNKKDLRGLHIYLTEKGRSLKTSVLAPVLSLNDEAVRGLSKAGIHELRSSVRRVINNLNGGKEKPGVANR